MATMHAVIVEQPGGPEQLTLKTVPRPVVKPGWTLIHVVARGINHSEVFTRQGLSPSVSFPRILGIEAVGTVAATTATARLAVGQTVITFMGEMGRAYDGSYAEDVLVPDDQVFPVTTDLSWSELAAVPETGYTAYGALQGLRLQAGDHLLVRGGTSGVGVMAATLAPAMAANLTMTASTRSRAKADRLRAAGFSATVIDQNGHLATSQRFDKILDLIGPATAPDSLQHLNPGGIVSATGQLGGQWTLDGFDPIMQIPNDGYLTGFYSGDIDGARLQGLLDLITTHHLDVRPEKVFPLAEMAQAHAYLASQQSFGKVVVTTEAVDKFKNHA